MIEANTQLGFLKLPKSAFGYHENLIKSTMYGELKKQLGEDPMLHYKKYLISQNN